MLLSHQRLRLLMELQVGFHCYVSIRGIRPIGSLGMKVILAMIVCAVGLMCLTTVLKVGHRRGGCDVLECEVMGHGHLNTFS
jgi:hypothetical protein